MDEQRQSFVVKTETGSVRLMTQEEVNTFVRRTILRAKVSTASSVASGSTRRKKEDSRDIQEVVSSDERDETEHPTSDVGPKDEETRETIAPYGLSRGERLRALPVQYKRSVEVSEVRNGDVKKKAMAQGLASPFTRYSIHRARIARIAAATARKLDSTSPSEEDSRYDNSGPVGAVNRKFSWSSVEVEENSTSSSDECDGVVNTPPEEIRNCQPKPEIEKEQEQMQPMAASEEASSYSQLSKDRNASNNPDLADSEKRDSATSNTSTASEPVATTMESGNSGAHVLSHDEIKEIVVVSMECSQRSARVEIEALHNGSSEEDIAQGSRLLFQKAVATNALQAMHRAREAAQAEIKALVRESFRNAPESAQAEIRKTIRDTMQRSRETAKEEMSKLVRRIVKNRAKQSADNAGLPSPLRKEHSMNSELTQDTNEARWQTFNQNKPAYPSRGTFLSRHTTTDNKEKAATCRPSSRSDAESLTKRFSFSGSEHGAGTATPRSAEMPRGVDSECEESAPFDEMSGNQEYSSNQRGREGTSELADTAQNYPEKHGTSPTGSRVWQDSMEVPNTQLGPDMFVGQADSILAPASNRESVHSRNIPEQCVPHQDPTEGDLLGTVSSYTEKEPAKATHISVDETISVQDTLSHRPAQSGLENKEGGIPPATSNARPATATTPSATEMKADLLSHGTMSTRLVDSTVQLGEEEGILSPITLSPRSVDSTLAKEDLHSSYNSDAFSPSLHTRTQLAGYSVAYDGDRDDTGSVHAGGTSYPNNVPKTVDLVESLVSQTDDGSENGVIGESYNKSSTQTTMLQAAPGSALFSVEDKSKECDSVTIVHVFSSEFSVSGKLTARKRLAAVPGISVKSASSSALPSDIEESDKFSTNLVKTSRTSGDPGDTFNLNHGKMQHEESDSIEKSTRAVSVESSESNSMLSPKNGVDEVAESSPKTSMKIPTEQATADEDDSPFTKTFLTNDKQEDHDTHSYRSKKSKTPQIMRTPKGQSTRAKSTERSKTPRNRRTPKGHSTRDDHTNDSREDRDASSYRSRSSKKSRRKPPKDRSTKNLSVSGSHQQSKEAKPSSKKSFQSCRSRGSKASHKRTLKGRSTEGRGDSDSDTRPESTKSRRATPRPSWMQDHHCFDDDLGKILTLPSEEDSSSSSAPSVRFSPKQSDGDKNDPLETVVTEEFLARIASRKGSKITAEELQLLLETSSYKPSSTNASRFVEEHSGWDTVEEHSPDEHVTEEVSVGSTLESSERQGSHDVSEALSILPSFEKKQPRFCMGFMELWEDVDDIDYREEEEFLTRRSDVLSSTSNESEGYDTEAATGNAEQMPMKSPSFSFSGGDRSYSLSEEDEGDDDEDDEDQPQSFKKFLWW